MSEKNGDDPDPGAGGVGEPSFHRLGRRIADLSRELSQITRLAGEAAPRQMELDAAAAAFKSLAKAYANEPEAFSDAQLDLFGRHADTLEKMAADSPAAEADADARFADSAWRDNPFFDFVRRMFLSQSAWAENLAWNAPGLSEIERRRAAFFIRQAMAALSPSNTLLANPRALKAMFDSDGKSISRGFDHLQSDFDAGHRRLAVTQSDAGAFQLGVDLAATPGEIVLRNTLIELIRYTPSTPTVRAEPILIFPPWINKYYVLDLRPENSLAAWLRDQGFTVYMVSWRSADAETRDFTWDDYCALGGSAALEWVTAAHKAPVHAAGYCIGGALLAVLAARLAGQSPRLLASISLLAAQTDFSEPGDIGLFIDDSTLGGVEALIAGAGGVMPGEAMRDAFNLLRPQDLIWRYVEERYLLGEPPRSFDLLYWNSDQTNLPGPLHLGSLKRLYIDNALAKGAFAVEGFNVNLSDIAVPAFIHAARRDHISPFPSVYKGAHLLGGEVTFLLADSGHIAGVVNPPAAGKYRYWTSGALPPTADEWLEGAAEHPGSWWPVWADWLAHRSGGWIDPPSAIENAPRAPGEYVLETLDSIAAKRTPAG
ncbi:MAG: alpha/beta fold hydrolase [Alphaproteobacteria bacterium]|nr:alpha/beta fold hydrolase [Alphaproteobacteria bacterium]